MAAAGSVVAIGGDSAVAYAGALAAGISLGNPDVDYETLDLEGSYAAIDNSGNITVIATGGTIATDTGKEEASHNYFEPSDMAVGISTYDNARVKNSGDINATVAATTITAGDEDQDQFTLGLNAMMPIRKWTLRGQLAGFFGSHDYVGVTGMNLDLAETAEYDSNGIGIALMGGYPIGKGKHMLLPELGFEWYYANLDGFNTSVEGASNWEPGSSSESAADFSAVMNFQWMTETKAIGVTMMPSVSLGARHLLTDEAFGITQTIGGSNPFTVESTRNRTSGTGSVSLRFVGDALTAEIGYAGELGNESITSNLWLKIYYSF